MRFRHSSTQKTVNEMDALKWKGVILAINMPWSLQINLNAFLCWMQIWNFLLHNFDKRHYSNVHLISGFFSCWCRECIKENSSKYKGNFELFLFPFFGMEITCLITLKPGAEKLRSWRFSRHPYHYILLMSYVIADIWHKWPIMSYVSDDIWHMTFITYANMGVQRTVKTSAIQPQALK